MWRTAGLSSRKRLPHSQEKLLTPDTGQQALKKATRWPSLMYSSFLFFFFFTETSFHGANIIFLLLLPDFTMQRSSLGKQSCIGFWQIIMGAALEMWGTPSKERQNWNCTGFFFLCLLLHRHISTFSVLGNCTKVMQTNKEQTKLDVPADDNPRFSWITFSPEDCPISFATYRNIMKHNAHKQQPGIFVRQPKNFSLLNHNAILFLNSR